MADDDANATGGIHAAELARSVNGKNCAEVLRATKNDSSDMIKPREEQAGNAPAGEDLGGTAEHTFVIPNIRCLLQAEFKQLADKEGSSQKPAPRTNNVSRLAADSAKCRRGHNRSLDVSMVVDSKDRVNASTMTFSRLQRQLHSLRIQNAELRKQLSTRVSERNAGEKALLEKRLMVRQLQKLAESKGAFIAKQDEEVSRQNKLKSTYRDRMKGTA